MLDDAQAQRFAEALTDLCKQHGMMLWTATVTAPIMATAVSDDVAFRYMVELPDFGYAVIIRRMLGG